MRKLFAGTFLALFMSFGLGVGTTYALTSFTLNDGNGFAPDQDYATIDITLTGNTLHVVVTALPGFGIFGNGAGKTPGNETGASAIGCVASSAK